MYKSIFDKVYDVVVTGGGLCGVGTALALADAGKKVLIVERRPALGWEVTSAFHCETGESNSPVMKQLMEKLNSMGGVRENRIDPPILELLLNHIFEQKKIDILFYSYPLRLVTRNNFVYGVGVATRNKEEVVRANVFIDATEEGLLWKQTGIEFVATPNTAYRYTILFNGISEGTNLSVGLGDAASVKNICVQPSVWKKEACVEFDVAECSISSARLALKDVIPFVREKVPQLRDAIITHTGFELFPLDVSACLKEKFSNHPQFKNLFASGVWTIPNEVERKKMNTVASRIKLGEDTAKTVADISVKIPSAGKIKTFSPPLQKFETDVIVAGGGAAGVFAAIAAARQGTRVTLLEAGTLLGGIGTGGGIHVYCIGIPGGIQDEIDRRVAELTPIFCGKYKVDGFHPEAKKLIYEQICNETGVKIIYDASTTGVKMSGKRVCGVIAAIPQGEICVDGKVTVDSTGDADIAEKAGVQFTLGRNSDELEHAYSQPIGFLDEKGNMKVINFDAGLVEAFDAEDLTRARFLGLKQYWQEHYTEDKRITYIAPQIGIRQSRQIVGDYTLTMEDEILGRKFDDCMSFVNANHDVHSTDIENETDETILWLWVLGQWSTLMGCEAPYRCMLPKKVEGLLVSSRSLSITVDASYEFRMQRDMHRIGEAAGVAASLAAKEGVVPRKIDVKKVQAELRKSGVLAKDKHPRTAIQERPVEELKKMILSDSPQHAVWLFAHSDRKVVPVLKGLLATAPKDSKFWVAAALAKHRCEDAVPVLIECINEKQELTLKGYKSAPRWLSSIAMLGWIENKKAVPTLLKVLFDKSSDINTLITAVRSLGRIGDISVSGDLVKFLKRPDLPKFRRLHFSMGPVKKQIDEDALWQVELATAEVLTKLGKPQNKIVNKYLNDERAYVRRYALKTKEILKI